PTPYNMLDAKLQLLDSGGNLVASADPSTTFGATISYTPSAGTYYLVVSSHGMSSQATSTHYCPDLGTHHTPRTTHPNRTAPPAAPSNLTATAASSSQINLTWIDNSNTEDGFKIERLSGGTWTEVATVGANVTSWSDSGLTAGTTYTYRVRAYNAGGNSAYTN